MKNLLRKTIIACLAATTLLTAATALAQSSPETSLHFIFQNISHCLLCL
jgi:hypothetical protein